MRVRLAVLVEVSLLVLGLTIKVGPVMAQPKGAALAPANATWKLRVAPVAEGQRKESRTFRLQLKVQKNRITGRYLGVPKKDEAEFTGEFVASRGTTVLWMKQAALAGDYRATFSGKQVADGKFTGTVYDVRGRVWHFELTLGAKK